MIKKVNKIFSLICLIIIIVFVLLLSYIIIIKNLEESTKSYERKINAYTIIGKSMEPNLKAGDLIITIKNKNNLYKENDIITFEYKDSYYNDIIITHRIIKVENKNNKVYYITQGDNNDFKDNISIENIDVIGKMLIKLPKLGQIEKLILTPPIWLIIVIVLSILIVIFNILKTFKKKKINKEQVFE